MTEVEERHISLARRLRLEKLFLWLMEGKSQAEFCRTNDVSEPTIVDDVKLLEATFGQNPRMGELQERLKLEALKRFPNMKDRDFNFLFSVIFPRQIQQQVRVEGKQEITHILQPVQMWEGDKPVLKEEKKDNEPKTP